MMRSDSLSIRKVRSDEVNYGERELAFDRILDARGRAVTDREVGRPPHRDGVADRVAVDLVVELLLVAAIDEIAHHAVVLEDTDRLRGDDVRGENRVAHIVPSLNGEGPACA